MEAPTWEALNVIENLVGVPPIVDTNNEITLVHIMSKLEKIEKEMPSMSKIIEVDCRILGNMNRLHSSIRNVSKILETLKLKDDDPSRINKIEEVIDALGTTLSSIKTKKVETPVKKGPKFNYVPKILQPKFDTPTTKGNETLKTMEEVPILNRIKNEPPIGITAFSFVPRSVSTRALFESPLKRTSCTIEELFDDLDDGSIDDT